VSPAMDEDAEPIAPGSDDAAGQAVKLSKADKLDAKAAKLREAAEQARQRDAEPPTPSGERPRGLAGWPLVAGGVLTLLLIAALVFTAVRWSQTSSKLDKAQRLSTIQASALKTARGYAADFATYDYAHLAADSKKVVSHLTPAFAKQYSSVSQQLSSLIVQYKGKETATVQGAGVTSVSTTQAVVVLFLDQTVTTTQSKTPQINRYRMTMTMDRQPSGSWLISNMTLK
jgi:Mce-associated membrane protein